MSDLDRQQRLQVELRRATDLGEPARAQLVAALATEDPELAAELQGLLAGDAPSTELQERSLLVSQSPANPSALAGERGYRLLRELGAGGMGTVHLAERADGAFRQQVAIKLLQPSLGASVEAERRFRSERQILADLQHPHITRLLDGGTTSDGRPFLVMEYVEGERLDTYADGLPLGDRLRLFVKVCRAVAYAHARGIVHRDLKPGNVLVDTDGEPRLLDFGIAKLLEPAADRTMLETALGRVPLTLLFASPEQVRGETVTPASDVYSLGVILYRLIAGVLPYGLEAEHPHSLAQAICDFDPERPSKRLRRLTQDGLTATSQRFTGAAELDAIVLRALRKETAGRYPNAEALADDVERLLSGRPVVARRGNALYRARKLVRRHAIAFGLILAGLLGVAASAALTRRLVAPPSLLGGGQTGRVAVLPVRNETGNPGYAWVEEGLAELMARVLDEAERVEVVAAADVARAVRDFAPVAPSAPTVGSAAPAAPVAAASEAATLARLRSALGADFTLSTRLLTRGPGDLRIDYLLLGAGGEPRWREVSGTELTALASEVAVRAVRRLDRDARPVALGELLSEDPTANTLYAMGFQELGRGNGKEAQHYFRVALHRAPDLQWARLMLARSLMTMAAGGEAEAALRQVLAGARAAGDDRLAGEALASLGRAAGDRGNLEAARAWNAEALEVLRRAGHRKGVASVLNNLGGLAWRRGDLDEADRQFRSSLVLLQELREPQGQAARLNNLGLIAAARKDRDAALDLYRRALAQAETSGDRALQGAVHTNLGMDALERGDLEKAAHAHERARVLAAALGDLSSQATAVLNLSVVAHRRGDGAAAAKLLRQALALSREASNPRLEGFALANLAFNLAESGDYPAAVAAGRAARALADRVEDSGLRDLATLNLAWAEVWSGDLAAADAVLAGVAAEDDDPTALRVRALLAYRRGHLAAALAGQERAKTVAPAVWLREHETLLELFRSAAVRGRVLPLPQPSGQSER